MRRGRPGLRGEEKTISHRGRELGGLRKILTLGGLFVFLKFLLTLGKVFSWVLRSHKDGTPMGSPDLGVYICLITHRMEC